MLSTFLKTKDASALTATENYRRMLIEIAAQLRKADTEFRHAATRRLGMLPAEIGKAQPRAACAGVLPDARQP